MSTTTRAVDNGGISISQDVLIASFSDAEAFKAAISTLTKNFVVEFEGVHPQAVFTDPGTFEAWYDARCAAASR